MQQFTVPQFIDVESKIIGPITTRQFLIFLGTGIFIVLFYKIFDFTLFLSISIPLALMAILFAFFKVNGRPFHYFVINLIQTWRRPRTRVWNNKINPLEVEVQNIVFPEKVQTKEFYHHSRLAELSLIVDTAGEYRGNWGDDEIVTSENNKTFN